MTQGKHETNTAGRLDSRTWKVIMVLLAGILTFAGPYLVYILSHLLEVDYAISFGSALIMFLVGLFLLWYLIKNKVLS